VPLDKEDQVIKLLVQLLLHVLDHSNITVSGILNPVVPVDSAQMNQDTSLELIDQDVTDHKRSVTASQDLIPKFGTVLDAQ
jgi:hypothetical protein